MKSNAPVTILVVVLLLLTVFLSIFNNIRLNRLRRQATIQSAKTNFLMHLGNKNVSIDSTAINNDTLLFYSNGSFIGKTVIIAR